MSVGSTQQVVVKLGFVLHQVVKSHDVVNSRVVLAFPQTRPDGFLSDFVASWEFVDEKVQDVWVDGAFLTNHGVDFLNPVGWFDGFCVCGSGV